MEDRVRSGQTVYRDAPGAAVEADAAVDAAAPENGAKAEKARKAASRKGKEGDE